MKCKGKIIEGTFLRRPNRFLSYFKVKGEQQEQMAHVPDPGRLKELLIKGAHIAVRKEDNADKTRKTNYTLVGVKMDDIWVNIESQIANQLFEEEYQIISDFKHLDIIKREVVFGKSRIDFLMFNTLTSKQVLIEIKSATLVKKGLALFPDAPTKRGKKHLLELDLALEAGFESSVVFMIKREDADRFSPHWERDPEFAATLKKIKERGVKIYALRCHYDPIHQKELVILNKVPVEI